MSDVTVTINGLRYRLVCEEGEEEHVAQLADHISNHVQAIKKGVGFVGNDRLLVMAALTVADELWEAKTRLRELREELDQSHAPQLAMELQSAVYRLELLQSRLSELEADKEHEGYDFYKEA